MLRHATSCARKLLHAWARMCMQAQGLQEEAEQRAVEDAARRRRKQREEEQMKEEEVRSSARD